MGPTRDTPQHMKASRAHLAYLNACRLVGGGTFAVNLIIIFSAVFKVIKAGIVCGQSLLFGCGP